MKNCYQINFKDNLLAYISLLLFFVCGFFLLINFTKTELFLIINGWHTDILDLVFPYITYLGDGIAVALVVIFLLFWKLGYAFDFLTAVLLSNVFIQGGKHWLFNEAARPKGLLGEDAIHIIEGVRVHAMHTFPSGHSATAMFMYLFLAIVIRNKLIQIFCILATFLAGYSRIYLSQHFFTDVYAGFLISTVCVLTVMTIRNNLGEPQWFNRPIFPV